MGTCVNKPKGAQGKFECESCSKNVSNISKKPTTLCPNGHNVCQLCMLRVRGQLHCPHCKTTIIQIKKVGSHQPVDSDIQKKAGVSLLKSVKQEQPDKIQEQYVLNEQKSTPSKNEVQQEPKSITNERKKQINQQSIKQNLFQQPIVSHLEQDKPKQTTAQAMTSLKHSKDHPTSVAEQLPSAKPNDQHQLTKKPAFQPVDKQKKEEGEDTDQKKEKKVCGCSIANFMVFIVLIIQTLFTAATVVYSVKQPRSQCMDVAHFHPLLAYRPLMQQISGIQTGITTIMGISAFIYKRGCLNESLFDNWMLFLKFMLSMKQLLWTALQAFMQVVIMPIYCDSDTMIFALVNSIANVVSFLMVIVKPVYSWICSKISS